MRTDLRFDVISCLQNRKQTQYGYHITGFQWSRDDLFNISDQQCLGPCAGASTVARWAILVVKFAIGFRTASCSGPMHQQPHLSIRDTVPGRWVTNATSTINLHDSFPYACWELKSPQNVSVTHCSCGNQQQLRLHWLHMHAQIAEALRMVTKTYNRRAKTRSAK